MISGCMNGSVGSGLTYRCIYVENGSREMDKGRGAKKNRRSGVIRS